MDQINKPVLSSPIGPLPVYSIQGFVVPSLISVIRLMTETYFIFMSLKALPHPLDEKQAVYTMIRYCTVMQFDI